MTKQQPDQRDLTHYFYNDLEPENRYPFLVRLLTEQPDANVPFFEMFLDTDELIYHFLRYMKSRYDMPFNLSERIANLIHSKGLFGRPAAPAGSFF